MADLIDRQAAIDALFELYEYQRCIDPTEAADLVRQGVYLAEKKIEQLPSVQSERAEGEWIPCSERLPKEKQSVLVTDGSVIWVCDIISTDEGYKWEDSHGYWLDLNEWIAWMKLPELYKEGDVINSIPAAQPEIIRCKDCIWYELPSHRITENCVRWMKSNGILLPIKPNDYCSYAERRTDG